MLLLLLFNTSIFNHRNKYHKIRNNETISDRTQTCTSYLTFIDLLKPIYLIANNGNILYSQIILHKLPAYLIFNIKNYFVIIENLIITKKMIKKGYPTFATKSLKLSIEIFQWISASINLVFLTQFGEASNNSFKNKSSFK